MIKNLFTTLRSRLRNNRIAMAVTLAASLVMPLCCLDMGTVDILGKMGLFPFDLTFCGFYGCIGLCLAWGRRWLWLKVLLVTINVVIIGFFILIGFMGGVYGPLILLLQMIVPIPWYRMVG